MTKQVFSLPSIKFLACLTHSCSYPLAIQFRTIHTIIVFQFYQNAIYTFTTINSAVPHTLPLFYHFNKTPLKSIPKQISIIPIVPPRRRSTAAKKEDEEENTGNLQTPSHILDTRGPTPFDAGRKEKGLLSHFASVVPNRKRANNI